MKYYMRESYVSIFVCHMTHWSSLCVCLCSYECAHVRNQLRADDTQESEQAVVIIILMSFVCRCVCCLLVCFYDTSQCLLPLSPRRLSTRRLYLFYLIYLP